MKYYIHLEGDDKFRLQTDNSWRLLNDKSFLDNDYFSETGKELFDVQKINSNIELNGKTWKLNPTSTSLFEQGILYYKIYTVRTSNPAIPSRQQLIDTIYNGNDNRNNTLILDTSGIYTLENFDKLNLSYDYPNIVVRNETFIAGNEYVGKKASKDGKFIDDLYNESLECWLINLQTGKTNLYSDGMYLNRTSEEVIKEIEDFNSSSR